MWGRGHCTSNITVYEDISRSDGQVNESNNQIYHFLALEKLSKNPPSDSFFHIENSEKNVPKDSHLRATFWKTANLLLGFGRPLIFEDFYESWGSLGTLIQNGKYPVETNIDVVSWKLGFQMYIWHKPVSIYTR